MTVKEFFKGKAFKCIAALLCVLLVSGIFLTVMNSLLYVTDEERFERAINKIYGKSVRTESVAVADFNTNATINEAYRVRDDGNYLVKSTGKGGFENGTVTCWVVVVMNGGRVAGVRNVTIDSNSGQSYIGRITQSFLSSFETNPAQDFYFSTSDGYLTSGASMSSNAICNAVNGAVDFVNGILGNTAADPFETYLFKDNIQTRQMQLPVYDAETNEVTFTVVSSGYGHAGNFTSDIVIDGATGTIKSFTVNVNGSTNNNYGSISNSNAQLLVGKNFDQIFALLNGSGENVPAYPGDGNLPSDLNPGASESTYSLYNAALFATANYQKVMPESDGGDTEENEEGGEANE